jgi:hypothetical protein
VKLPFGKHRGKQLADVPLGYLAWLHEEVQVKDRALRRAIRAAIADRIGATFDAYTPPPHWSPPPTLTADLIAAGFRQLALRHHPDHGGDHHRMIAATAARDWLLKQVGAA